VHEEMRIRNDDLRQEIPLEEELSSKHVVGNDAQARTGELIGNVRKSTEKKGSRVQGRDFAEMIPVHAQNYPSEIQN
jgi:hypothetical protein